MNYRYIIKNKYELKYIKDSNLIKGINDIESYYDTDSMVIFTNNNIFILCCIGLCEDCYSKEDCSIDLNNIINIYVADLIRKEKFKIILDETICL